MRYFLVEVVMSLSFVGIFNSGFNLGNILLAVMVSVSVATAVMDWETMLVSEVLVAIWGVAAFAFKYVSSGFDLSSTIIGVVVSVGLIGGLWLVSKGRAMGFGDIEIAAVMGLLLGWPDIGIALWLAFVTGALVGVVLLVQRRSKLTAQIAFGPFLILGTWVAYLASDTIISWLTFHF